MVGKFLYPLILVCSALFLSCSDSMQHFSKHTASVETEGVVEELLKESAPIDGEMILSRCALDNFYGSRLYQTAWIQSESFTPQGDSLMRILHNADYLGLIPEDYHLNKIDSLRKNIKKEDNDDIASLAKLDILMTDAWLTMGYHIRYGRIQKDEWQPVSLTESIDTTLLAVLSGFVHKNNIRAGLESLEPRYPVYSALKRELKSKLDSLSLTLADTTVEKLKVKVRDLTVNMEQWRWEGDDIKGRYIMVNIPSYRLEVIDNDSMVFESNVVVGTTNTQTPTLDANIKSFVLYPNWNVPRKIATTELLPKIKKDSAYLASNHYRVLNIKGEEVHPDSVNWSRYHDNNFPFMIQQSEGDYNALGIIKFPFVNDYGVYLHDTNAKRYFRKPKRAYSHGCVRVERAIDLAKFLVKDNNPYCTTRDLDHYLAKRSQHQICMNPINLHIRYYTCEVTKDGTVLFFDDVYGRNQLLIDALYCKN